MTTGFGFCPTCGTPRQAADQRFCPVCGSALAAPAPAAPPPPVAAATPPPPPPPPTTPAESRAEAAAPVPADWTSPIPPPPAPQPEGAAPAAQPPAAPAWSIPAAPPPAPAPQYYPAYPGAPAGYPAGAPTPAAPGKPIATIGSVRVTPMLLAIGAVVLVAVLVGAFLLLSSGSKSGGEITVSPATYSCSSSTMVTATMRLPSTVQATDALVFQQDGKTVDTLGITIHPTDMFTRQSDGSWLYTRTDTASSNCTGSSGEQLSMGAHTMTILDSAGHVLAQGSFTLTP